MVMTFSQYILNPMGRNNAVLNSTMRESMRNTYMKKFNNIMLRENGRFRYYLYKDNKNNTYWIHIKIPSETVRNFYYDTVIKFFTDQKIESDGQDLFKYNVRFYSNDPAFVYTYANVFIQNDLFIKELREKMSKEALRKAPKEKNPGNNVGYVKSLYLAYLYMQNTNLNKKIKFEAQCKPFNLKQLLADIEDADKKIEDRQREGEKQEKTKRPKTNTTNVVSDSDSNNGFFGVRKTKSIQSSSSIKTSMKTKKVGSVKRK